MRYIVSFSGGLCSWFAARRLVDRYGPRNITLLFADTLVEWPDLYRFLNDASEDLGIPVTRIADGRTPWELFGDERFIGNTRVDICSRVLKRDLLDKWSRENCDPRHTVKVAGLSYGERDRYIRWKRRMRARGWRTEAPAMAPPYATKADMLAALRARGLEPSDSYDDGFAHDNCRGACVKQGVGGWRRLLHKRRAVYIENENEEEKFRARTGKDVSILRDRTGGTTKPLTLRVLRESIESGLLFGMGPDDGGCGCAID